ncbi:MAG: rhodanese-like domain-containing protein [Bacteroidales bacterium]
MTKLTFSSTDGRLLGAQVVGHIGVDKRIDQLAMIIKIKGTVMDLMKIEHAYAPPFSSAKDPIAIAGYVATNVLTKEMPILNWKEMYKSLHGMGTIKNLRVIDVRTKEEVSKDPIEGTDNIPLDDLRSRLSELDPQQPTLVYCIVGLRGYLAQKILLGNGFKEVYNLTGGLRIYQPAVEALTAK